MNRSNISFSTSAARASGRSILLMTTIGGRPRANALPSTNRVCGSGPSDASTSSTTPSTIDSVRSTSPPKSAWPGVSTMLIRMSLVVDGGVLGQDRDAALALELVAVHGALGDALVRAERAALVQQGVDERGFAVIDVGDDGDVAAVRVGDRGANFPTKTSQQYSRASLVALHERQSLTGSASVCTSCGSLVGVRDEKCFNCGRRNPGLWGFAPLLRSARQRSRLRAARRLGQRRAVCHLAAALGQRDRHGRRPLRLSRPGPERAVSARRERRRPGLRLRPLVDGAERRLAARQPAPHHLQHDVGARSRPGGRRHVRRRGAW